MSTNLGPDDPGDGSRRVGQDDLPTGDDISYTEEVRTGEGVPPTRPVEGTVTRREVITPSASDPVTVRGADTERRAGPCWNRIVGETLGAIYLIGGIAGFFLKHRPGVKFAGAEGTTLFGLFEVNDLHSVVHVVIGAVLLLGALAGHSAARGANLLVALVYLIVGIAGIFAHDTDLDVLALNPADHWLHLGTAALLGLTALADRGPHDEMVSARRTRTS